MLEKFVDHTMAGGDRLLVDIPERDRLFEMRPAQYDAVVHDHEASREAAYGAGDLQHPDPAAMAAHQFEQSGAVALHEFGVAQHDQDFGFAIAAQQPVDRFGERAPIEAVEITPV